ncbi:methylmalonyl Co-A mutase-associated GTPase MeaB [Truepera radiovictrix]|uniref:LAO/AO transport system ATPase n=1 Tax=Truepera radiovictrix (strain DSM 17093 / CIP 108686 / LMG 22925 / RQ-24) TaxID=649638 RepID=D7CSS3_TRURR|nr:methylmalonyl Co-A mutase-associated GTPase MeaB [Truepera radiovictrix]ADI13690.1 LAO/AO transport system ATPase [Truepera radiovictrix DSM 17093]WMT57746.1 methylmalonyl Co-A mutase-associated GTPase MeaB [Truepera radiovictrix]
MKREGLESRFLDRNERALARAISLIEAGDEAGQALLQRVRRHGGRAQIVGVTGSPGSGKSTLTDALIEVARAKGKRVAVVAVDPTSPYSGGAILGDRIRMMRHHGDPGVFIRSMATRGHLGGLATATLQVVALLDAYGFDVIFVETVGVGQSEVDIVRVADTTVLVLTPGQGDGVQAFKAGIMEVADVFVINKFDQPGGDRLRREIKAALELSAWAPEAWRPPIVQTVASEGAGVAELFEQLGAHREHLLQTGEIERKRLERVRFEVASLLRGEVQRRVEAKGAAFVEAVLAGETSVTAVVDEFLGAVRS